MIRRPEVARRAAAVTMIAVLLALAGCSSGSGGAASPTSSSTTSLGATSDFVAPQGFTTVTLRVTRPDGTVEEWCLWLADSAASRAEGLMRVTDPELGGAAGMVFSFAEDTSGAFWMRNTPLPLSIAWYDGEGDLVSSTDMDPCPADAADTACPRHAPGRPYRYAIEVPQGRLADLGLADGSTIELGDTCVLAA